MSERYRLVFRGEVLEGQHKAVVKQRLGVALKVDGERLDAMFTGKAVTIRKDADTDTAAKFQIAFKRAGARLRVLPIDVEPDVSELEAKASAPVAPDASADGFGLAPVGATLVEPRPAAPAPAVDISHMTLAAPGVALSTPKAITAVVPDVSKWTLAAPGTLLGVPVPFVARPVAAPSWEIGDLGVDLTDRLPAIEAPFDLGEIDFELAPPGTLLRDSDEVAQPEPPDTSHLHLV